MNLLQQNIAEYTKDLPRWSYEEFLEFQPELIIPLDIKIDVDQFKNEIEPYRKYFRKWGTTRHDYPRYGISLKNLTGRLDDDIDPACWPSDKWIQENPNNRLWYHDYKHFTELVDLPSLRPMKVIEQHMLRSNILLWNRSGHFIPHVDIDKRLITHIRLWGVTSNSDAYTLAFGGKIIEDYEPGRLYLINTIETHEAYALEDDVFTFLLNYDLSAKQTLSELKI